MEMERQGLRTGRLAVSRRLRGVVKGAWGAWAGRGRGRALAVG